MKNKRGKKVSLKFFIDVDDLAGLQGEIDNFDEFEEYEERKEDICKAESFVINSFITLKLEDNTTHIYIKGKRFMQCIRLVLNIPIDNIQEYDEVKSIDDAIDINRKSLNRNQIVEGPMARPIFGFANSISPEEEFRGHCSNIQTWVENNYNTCLLHSNLAFPLLKKLTEVGDPLAKRIFKEEIAKRYELGNEAVRQYLKELGYLKYLSHEELITLMEEVREKEYRSSNRDIKKDKNSPKIGAIKNFVDYYNASKYYLNKEKRREFLENCTKTLFDLYKNSFNIKNEPKFQKEINQLIIKRKLLDRELQTLKKEIYVRGRLWEFLKTLEVLIRYLDPNLIIYNLESFKIES